MSRKHKNAKVKADGRFKLKKFKLVVKGLQGEFNVDAFLNSFSNGVVANQDNRNNRNNQDKHQKP